MKRPHAQGQERDRDYPEVISKLYKLAEILGPRTSVVEALKLQHILLHDDILRWQNREQWLYEEAVEMRDRSGHSRTRIMPRTRREDVHTFAEELDVSLEARSPAERNLFAKNAQMLVYLMRSVDYNSLHGFKGHQGGGLELDSILLRAEDFQDPDMSEAVNRSSWQRPVIGASRLEFICGQNGLRANSHGSLELNAMEGLAILGFRNNAWAPSTSTVDIVHLSVQHNTENLEFPIAAEIMDSDIPGHLLKALESGGPAISESSVTMVNRIIAAILSIAPWSEGIIELKQPLIVFPYESCRVNVSYSLPSCDELQPIGLWIKTSEKMRPVRS